MASAAACPAVSFSWPAHGRRSLPCHAPVPSDTVEKLRPPSREPVVDYSIASVKSAAQIGDSSVVCSSGGDQLPPMSKPSAAQAHQADQRQADATRAVPAESGMATMRCRANSASADCRRLIERHCIRSRHETGACFALATSANCFITGSARKCAFDSRKAPQMALPLTLRRFAITREWQSGLGSAPMVE